MARNRDVVLAVFEGGQPKMATYEAFLETIVTMRYHPRRSSVTTARAAARAPGG